jgi:hypothetical protein
MNDINDSNDINDLEQQLRSALARQEPSPDFAAKVLRRADQRGRTAWKPWAAGCVAASLLIGAWGTGEIRERRERERGLVAHAQLVRALGITASKLQRIQRKVDALNHE